jgi:hypothetical protein
MTRPAVTMTTSTRVGFVANPFDSNSALGLSVAELSDEILRSAISAITWTTDVFPVSDKMARVIGAATECLSVAIPNYQTWLMAGTSAAQPNTRIVRHRGLWGLLGCRRVDVSRFKETHEQSFLTPAGIKFAGAAQAATSAPGLFASVMLEERATFLITVPANTDVVDSLKSGPIESAFDSSRILFAIRSGGLVLMRLGAFDDSDAGLVALGASALATDIHRTCIEFCSLRDR